MIRQFEQYQAKIGKNVLLDPSSLLIGQVELGDDVSIWPMSVLRGDVEAIRIAARTNIQDGTICHVTHYSQEYSSKGLPLLVGEDVTVGHRAILHACTIGNRCLIGMGSSLLDASVIEDEVMIGANSLVPPGKVLASGYLYVGSPVKQVRPLSTKEKAFLKYSAEHYVELKNRHLASL